MSKRMVSFVLASSLMLSVASNGSAETAYLTLRGQKSGDVKGSVTQKGREGSIQVLAWSHSIVSPRDAASGLPTGKRMHKPFIITKPLDKSSPILDNMLATNESISTLTIKVWAPDLKGGVGAAATGVEQQVYTVSLTNASIASIDSHMTKVDGKDVIYEEVAFSYQKISWTWNDGGIMAQDDWMATH